MADDAKEKFESILDDLENSFERKKEIWNNTIKELANRLRNKNPKELVDLQADTISQKQMVVDETTDYLVKLAKDTSKKKSLYKSKIEIYKVHPIKLTTGEMGKMIESDLSLYERKLNIYEAYIEYLRETGKNLEQINYGIKNKIELINQFGID
jgi:exonuclease VII large subunit